jgi:ABC-2 type transport system ATP-binding protein
MSNDEFIAVRQLTHRYPRADRAALDDVSLSVQRGNTFGLLGPNGAGKSTLLAILTGITPLQNGSVSIGGRSLATQAREIKMRGALVPQEYAFYPRLTGRENLRFFGGAYGLATAEIERRIPACIESCQLGEVVDRHAKHYSGGLKRRLNLAIGLLARPEVLYLDEPTVGIDAISRECILQAIASFKAQGTTIVYTSHYMEEIERLCDEVAVIDHGRILIQERVDRLLRTDANRSLQLAFSQTLGEAARALLEQRNAIFIDNSHVQLVVENKELAALLAQLSLHDATPVQVTYGVSRLHDVYLTLLKESA